MPPTPSRPVSTLLVAAFVVIVVGLALHASIGHTLPQLVPMFGLRREAELPEDSSSEYAMHRYDPPTSYARHPFEAPLDIERIWYPKYSRIYDRVFPDLGRFKQLRELHVEASHFAPSALDGIRTLQPLKHLYLNGSSGLTSFNLESLNALPELETLSLSHCELTDDHLLPIGKLRFIRVLNLSSTAITDTGIRHLNDMQYLEVLYVNDTAVTAFGINELANLRSVRAIHGDRLETRYLHDRLRHKVWNRNDYLLAPDSGDN